MATKEPENSELLLKFQHCMVLSGVGDALGYNDGAFEFCHSGKSIQDTVKTSGGLSELTPTAAKMTVSDDTVMHIATAEALASDFKSEEQLYCELAKNYKACMKDMAGRAPGITTKNTVIMLKPDVKKGYVIPFNERGGGCGAAMRAVPIGLLYWRPEDIESLVRVAVEAGRMTHNHPTGFLGSVAVAVFVSYAVQGKPVREWGEGLMDTLPIAKRYCEQQKRDWEQIQENWGYFEEQWKDYLAKRNILTIHVDKLEHQTGATPDLIDLSSDLDAIEYDKFVKSVSSKGTGGASGHDAPMIAYESILRTYEISDPTTRWETVCRYGMFHGGDSDSTGIIAGACYGAMFGLEGVPLNNYNKLEYRDRLERLGRSLFSKYSGIVISKKGIETEENASKECCGPTVGTQARFRACMLLGGVGDALGFNDGKWEVCSSGEQIQEEARRMGGVSALRPTARKMRVSDDTVLHLATAEALLFPGSGDSQDQLCLALAVAYKQAMRNMKDRSPGQASMQAIAKLKPFMKEYTIPFNKRGGGCGAAMRAVPIGLLYWRPEDTESLVRVAVEAGRMTHNHPTGFLGSVAVAVFVSYAVQGKPVREWGKGLMDILPIAKRYCEQQKRDWEQIRENWGYFEEQWKNYLPSTLDTVLKDIKPSSYDKFVKSVSFSGIGGSSGHDAPLIAYDAILRCYQVPDPTTRWETVCRYGMFHGGDSDSTGIIAGACYGAMFGLEGVPLNNYSHIEYKEKLERFGDSLFINSHI